MSSSAPLSPPPPATLDDETAQQVDDSLAKRQQRRWRKTSVASPMSPTSDSSSIPSRDAEEAPKEATGRSTQEAESAPMDGGEPSRPSRVNTLLKPIPKRLQPSRMETGGSVKLEGLVQADENEMPTRKVLYRYAEIYENQRGFSRLGSQNFSTRALNLMFHYKDPAAFSKYEQTEEGLKEVNLPYASLNDVQLPSADWDWHSPEWLIDMAGDGVTAYDGFRYNTHFQAKGWTPVAPRWHSYFLTCVRRRRWLRLMVYLPSLVSSDSKGIYHAPSSHIPAASEPTTPYPRDTDQADESTTNLPTPGKGKGVASPSIDGEEHESPHSQFDIFEIWKGNDNDWSRVHAALKSLRRDGRRLELWKAWTGDKGEDEQGDMLTPLGRLSSERKEIERQRVRGVRWTEDQGMTMERHKDESRVPMTQFMTEEPLSVSVDDSKAPKKFLEKVLNEHASEILSLFIYPDSRSKFHDMLQRCQLLDALPPSASFSMSTDFRERLEV